MTEQEIIYCLKENKIKGVAYFFLPEQVRDWVHDNLYEKCLMVLDSFGKFIFLDDVETGLINTDDYDNVVFTLPDNYKPKQEPKGEWVEFDVDQKGNFHCFIDGDIHYFFWANWNVFLTEADSSGYTVFGGWQYKNCNIWFTAPQLQSSDGIVCDGYDNNDKPLTPIKIRFWREK